MADSSGMWGAPAGIMAAEDQHNQNRQAQLTAMETMGKVAMQPTEQKMKESQALYYGALGAEHQVNADDKKIMAKLAQEGQIATVNDRPDEGAPKTALEALQQLEQRSRGKVSPAASAALAKQIADIQKVQAQAGASEATQQLAKLNFGLKHAERISGVVGAMIANPGQYAQLRLAAAQEGLDISRLPESYDARSLVALRDQGMGISEQLKKQAREIEQKSKDRARGAQSSAANANIAVATQRAKNLKQTHEFREKYEGENSQAAVDAKKASRDASANLRQAQLAKTHPPMPLNPSDWELGKVYHKGDGTFRHVVRNAEGVLGSVPVQAPLGWKQTGMRAAPPPEELEDDLLDEEIE